MHHVKRVEHKDKTVLYILFLFFFFNIKNTIWIFHSVRHRTAQHFEWKFKHYFSHLFIYDRIVIWAKPYRMPVCWALKNRSKCAAMLICGLKICSFASHFRSYFRFFVQRNEFDWRNFMEPSDYNLSSLRY